MQNGELDGYEAKLVVWNVCGPARAPVAARGPLSRRRRGLRRRHRRNPCAPAEGQDSAPRRVSARQAAQSHREWREIAAANAAAFDELVDDETVFYADFGERFFLPDGSYNGDIWGIPGPAGVGAQPPLYEVWAEELQPWLDRFVR